MSIEQLEQLRCEDEQSVLREVWGALDSPIKRVVNEMGVNVADAQVRHLARQTWLYVDDCDGFALLSDDDMAALRLSVWD